MPRTFEASHTETIVLFVEHHLLADFFFNHCVSANTDALHFHKSGITFKLRLNTINVKSVSFHIMIELQFY